MSIDVNVNILYAYLEENIDNEDVEHILQGVDDAVEHSLEFGHALDGLEGPENPQDPERFNGAEILSGGAPPAIRGRA